ncbi:MAG: S41 family peptidase, partial [Gammaproteobacteria bacterium]|nr:S41 family peptidase [Gammaproteobacteria bacterium]
TRDIIRVKSVKSRILDENYGYIRITSFQSKTGDNLVSELDKLADETKSGMKGIVLDLRNNPGGVLNAAVQVSDAFLNSGKIVYTEGRDADSRLEFNATPGDVLSGAPIVVLVNGGSASASEIVAGALQDHKRAIIMGAKTFGKGSVQTILPMNSNAALKLTTARYYTPSGRSIQAEGIKPDIKLESLRVSKVESEFKRVKEADLARHLENADVKGNAAENKKDKKEDEATKLADEDYQLYEALNILKAINLSAMAK